MMLYKEITSDGERSLAQCSVDGGLVRIHAGDGSIQPRAVAWEDKGGLFVVLRSMMPYFAYDKSPDNSGCGRAAREQRP